MNYDNSGTSPAELDSRIKSLESLIPYLESKISELSEKTTNDFNAFHPWSQPTPSQTIRYDRLRPIKTLGDAGVTLSWGGIWKDGVFTGVTDPAPTGNESDLGGKWITLTPQVGDYIIFKAELDSQSDVSAAKVITQGTVPQNTSTEKYWVLGQYNQDYIAYHWGGGDIIYSSQEDGTNCVANLWYDAEGTYLSSGSTAPTPDAGRFWYGILDTMTKSDLETIIETSFDCDGDTVIVLKHYQMCFPPE